MDKYELLRIIGVGSFGTVYEAIEKDTGEIVAIKKFKKKYINWEECKNLREVKSLTCLKHENIVKLKEMNRVDDVLNLTFEYMESSLFDLMDKKQRNNQNFTEDEIRKIIFQTLTGTAYMHKYGFFHRDFKPENILVRGEVIKIADFGLAREIRSLPPYTDYVSTRWYRAPECLLGSTSYNSPVDVWAIGVIMAELYNLKPLFPGTTQRDTLMKICNILGPPLNWNEGLMLAKKIDFKFFSNLSSSLKISIPNATQEALDLISQMLQWDPSKRPSAQSLLSHSFFTKIDCRADFKNKHISPKKPKNLKADDGLMNSSMSKFGKTIFSNKINQKHQHQETSSMKKEETPNFDKSNKPILTIVIHNIKRHKDEEEKDSYLKISNVNLFLTIGDGKLFF
jgi:serine/threonine protein kinase